MPTPLSAPPPTYLEARAQAALDRASKRISRHLATLPDVEETAFHLTERELFALSTAWAAGCGTLRCQETFRAELFREGLADKAGYFTAFGMAVRRFVVAQHS